MNRHGESAALKSCLSDLIGLLSFQAISCGRDPCEIIRSLLEMLVGLLRLELAYAEVPPASGRPRVGLVHRASPPGTYRPASAPNDLPAGIRSLADDWLADRSSDSPFVIHRRTQDGEVSVVLVRLGLRIEAGWLALCARRAAFPLQTERVLLGVAANQAAIAVQEARLRIEQAQLARELEARVTERTRELRSANRELQRALRVIHRLRDDLERENRTLREQVSAARGGLAPWQLQRAVTMMSGKLSEPVPLSRLAAECGLSVRHFARAFRESTGVPPHRWLLNRRVERAKELLCNGELSLSDVALVCGFANQSHFTRTFAASVRVSPGLWRRLQTPPRDATMSVS